MWGIVVITVAVILGVVGIAFVLRNDPDATRIVLVVTGVFGFATPTLLALRASLEAQRTRADLSNGVLKKAIKEAIEEDRKEREARNGQSAI